MDDLQTKLNEVEAALDRQFEPGRLLSLIRQADDAVAIQLLVMLGDYRAGKASREARHETWDEAMTALDKALAVARSPSLTIGHRE